MRNLVIKPITDKAALDAADDADHGRRDGAGRHRRHRAGGDRRSHDRQQPGDVPLQARGREDAGGGGGLRGRRPEVPRRRVHHPERRPRRARADAEGARAVGVRGGGGADACATHDLDVPRIGYVHSWREHAGRRLGARRVRHLRRALHLLRRHQAARGQPARRSTTSSSSRTSAATRSRRSTALPKTGGAPLPYKKTAETPNLGAHRSGRRHPRRHGLGRPDGAA